MFLSMIFGNQKEAKTKKNERKINPDYSYLNPNNTENTILKFKEEYDEDINFYHFRHLFRKFEYSENIKEFPLLTNHEFLISENSNKDQKFLKSSDAINKDNLHNIRIIIKQFVTTDDSNFKLLFLDNLSSYIEKIGLENTSDLIVPILLKIVEDPYNLRKKLMEIFPKVVEAVKTFSTVESYNLIRDDLLKIVINMLTDKTESDLLRLTGDSFVLIAKSLNVDDVANLILATVIGFAVTVEEDMSSRIESKTLAAKLFGDLASILGKDLCESYVVPQLIFLAEDNNFKVRKAVVLSLINLAEVLSYLTITNKLIPIYSTLCYDNLWTIRKACVEILPNMMTIYKKKSNYSAKNEIFLELFNNFVLDSQKFVRVAVLEIFGPFISHLEKEELHQTYFDFFKNSLEEYFFNVKEFNLETQSSFYLSIKYNWAYNFPALIFCYGKEYWHMVKRIYSELAKDNHLKVKKCIISSFHELVKLLDEDDVKNDLLPLYDDFITSTNNEIRSLALKKLPCFMDHLEPDFRMKYRNYFKIYNIDFILNQAKWRSKIEILENYENYFDLFENEIILNRIIPLVVKFCRDEIFIVRKKSAKLLSEIFLHLLSNENNQNQQHISEISKHLEHIAYDTDFKIRCLLVYASKCLINNPIAYREILKKIFDYMVFDKIVDVRICLAKFFSKILKLGEHTNSREKEKFLYMCDVLSKDEKKSVRLYFENTKFKSGLLKYNPEKEMKLNSDDLNIHKINDNLQYAETNQILVEDLDSQLERIKPSSININQESDSEIGNLI